MYLACVRFGSDHDQIVPLAGGSSKHRIRGRPTKGCDIARSGDARGAPKQWCRPGSESGGAHVDLGAEAKASGKAIPGQVEDHPLAGTQSAQDAALESGFVEFDFSQVRVGQDDPGSGPWIEGFDDALHDVTSMQRERCGRPW